MAIMKNLTLRAKYDDRVIEVTQEYIHFLRNLMKAKCEMMIANGASPGDWYWGRCKILDLSLSSGSLQFTFGSLEDMPDDGFGKFAVTSMQI